MSSASLNKKVITYIAAVLISFSLSGQDKQVSSIKFNKLVHNFGDILLSSGKQSCTFTFANVSKQPVVIQTVISSCGCTTPQWTKSPIKPGATGKIDVTFLNDQGPYPFDKSLTVYVTGSSRPTVLRIKGVVHQKKKNIKQMFPVSFGSIGVRKSPVEVGQITKGTINRGSIEIANISGSPAKVTFVDLTPGLSLSVNPATIQPGNKAELSINIDTRNTSNWGSITYQATPVVNGKRTSKKLVFQAAIREDFSNFSKDQINKSSLPMASKSSYNFGSVTTGNKIQTTFEIKNIGKGDLIIHKIDVSENGMSANFPGRIAPGATGKISVTITTAGDHGEKIFIFTLITNSPSRPLVNLMVTGNVI